MLVSETDLALFRECPAGYEKYKMGKPNRQLGSFSAGIILETPVQAVTRWLWASQLRTGFQSTLRATKHKWGQLVTQWGTECGLAHRQTRDYLTLHMSALIAYHHFYLTSGCVPLSVGNPTRVKVGRHTLITLPQAVVASGDTPLLLNTSCDSSNRDTSNNFVYRARLHAVVHLSKRPMAMLSHRFAGRLESAGFRHSHMCSEGFLNNLELTLDLMEAGFNAPSVICKSKCPCKES